VAPNGRPAGTCLLWPWTMADSTRRRSPAQSGPKQWVAVADLSRHAPRGDAFPGPDAHGPPSPRNTADPCALARSPPSRHGCRPTNQVIDRPAGGVDSRAGSSGTDPGKTPGPRVRGPRGRSGDTQPGVPARSLLALLIERSLPRVAQQAVCPPLPVDGTEPLWPQR